MNEKQNVSDFIQLLRRGPQAHAVIKGSSIYPDIKGSMNFYQARNGVLVIAEVYGLPKGDGACGSPIFAFHIHEGKSCTGDDMDEFADAMKHYNPYDCIHPYHAGDLPPLFGNDGYAFSAFLTNRFSVKEIMGKTVIIHSEPDDFATQPSGNSGEKIACGQIK